NARRPAPGGRARRGLGANRERGKLVGTTPTFPCRGVPPGLHALGGSLTLLAFRPLAGLFAAALVALRAGGPAAGPEPAGGARANPVQQKGVPADTSSRKALIIEGDDHLFMVAAPRGWVLDDTAGMGSRIRCVFYPKGQAWSTAHTVMY